MLFITVLLGCKSDSDSKSDAAVVLPDSIYSGEQGAFHVQGMAVDEENGFIYFSFTDKLIKMDLQGNMIGSVTGLVGHLGDLTFDPETDKIYGSLEYKNDAIGRGINKKLGLEKKNDVNFYIAIFDGKQITKPEMNAANKAVLKTVYLKEVVDDYKATVKEGNRTVKHRFGCSGIDGVTLAPSFGKEKGEKKYLYVAYGIYGDTSRKDNDNQVILKYDISNWNKTGEELLQDNPHHSGPDKPLAKYFVRTGNTRYGIQNMEYDPYTGNFYAAVYPGDKNGFPNYSLFVIDAHKEPFERNIVSNDDTMKVQSLSLLQIGKNDSLSSGGGWHFKWGATGIFPLGDGLFYISHNKKTKDGQQSTTVYKYRWIGSDEEAFRRVD